MTQQARLTPTTSRILRFGLVAGAYLLAHSYGYLMRVPPQNVAGVWPASGLALGLMLVTDRRDRVATALALCVGNLVSSELAGNSIGTTVAFLLCNVFETGLGLALFAALGRSSLSLASVTDVGILVTAATLGNAVSAVPAAAVVNQAFGLAWRDAYAVWWASDGLGILLVTPLVIALAKVFTRAPRPPLRVTQEPLLFIVIWTIAAWAVFQIGNVFVALPYALLALLAWGGLRLGPGTVALALSILTVSASTSPLVGFGPSPLGGDDAWSRMLLMQAYLAVTGVMGLLLAASRSETRDALVAASEEQARVKSLADHLPDGVVFRLAWEGAPRFQDVSAGVVDVTGLPVERVLGDARCLLDLIALDDRPRLRLLDQEPDGKVGAIKTDVEIRRPDGTSRQVAVSCAARELPDGTYVWDGILMDVTERIAAQEALRLSQARVQEAERMELVGRLAGGVAHDFNNLLTIIIGFADMMLSNLPQPEMHGAAEQIQRAATRASSLTQQLLAVGRRLIMRPEPVALSDVITSTDQLVRRTLGGLIEVLHTLEPGLPQVLVDAHQLERVLLNLVLNARDAMPDGGRLTLSTGTTQVSPVMAEQRRVPAGPYVHFAVSDTGTGMSDDVRSHLFEPFFTTKPVGRGTGLGLAAVEGIVRQSGGFIVVDTSDGAGTTFTVCLPPTDVARAFAVPSQLARPRGSERILLVEDDDALRRLTEMVLRRQGYSVVTASGGKLALVEASEGPSPFDLVVTDVVMRGMAGPELVDHLRRAQPTLRALFISGHSDDAVLRAGIAEGRTDFLQKPFTPEALATKVRTILDA